MHAFDVMAKESRMFASTMEAIDDAIPHRRSKIEFSPKADKRLEGKNLKSENLGKQRR
jgi:hypothetical protein